MKQFAFKYSDPPSFENELRGLEKQGFSQNRMLFYIYSEIIGKETADAVCGAIGKVFPHSDYVGCSTSGNIVDCGLAPEISVVCNIFEKGSTKFMVRAYETTADTADGTAGKIVSESSVNPWVKAIEMYYTIPASGSFTKFCSAMDSIDPNVKLFGGVACNNEITSNDCCLFSKAGYFTHAVIAVFMGGDEFYAEDVKITGWKQLRRTFRVTSAEGCILKELDGIPADKIYKKYLGIESGENFYFNTLEFPLFYEHNGTTILRVPVSANDDGSIAMSSDIDENAVVRLSYGDPQTVLESISERSDGIREFSPDVMHIFSCAARRTFWDNTDPTYELSSFSDISPSAGFFSHGEFIRTNGSLNQHNVTLVIAAMREGERQAVPRREEKNAVSMSKIPLVLRLARFIAESTKELEEAVITDGLTGLCNRMEIQTRIEEQLGNDGGNCCIVMLDIDNFKKVNDTYGHQMGDAVIRTLSALLKDVGGSSSGGRWGGEEFMLLLPDTDISEAENIAESIRRKFEDTKYPSIPSQTVSIGVTRANADDTADTLCTRVDKALYKAKQSGKNMVVKA